MRIEREATNSFTLAARPTVSPSRWLLRFNRENDPATEQLCIATALATTGMPVLLTFEEVDSSPDPQAGEVTLSTGQWRLRVYEQTTTSLNYANSTRSVYDVLVEVVGAEIPDPDPTDPCEGDGGDCPEDCEVIEGMDASEIVACVPSADRPALLCEVMDTAEATPEAIVVCLDGANKTDAVRAIICNPCPECNPLELTVNGVAFEEVEDPCGATTNVRVLDADDNPVGSLDAPDWRIPSATVQLKDSAGDDIGSADSYLPGANTTKTAPDGSVQRQDSVGANIGTPIAVRSNQTGLAVTCPDGTVNVQNLNGTTLGSPTVKSNGSTNYTAPIPLKFGWGAGDADTLTWTVTDDEAGSYTAFTSDGGSGTLTYSKNGGAFAALSGSIALAVSDTIVVRRTTSTSNGWVKWAP